MHKKTHDGQRLKSIMGFAFLSVMPGDLQGQGTEGVEWTQEVAPSTTTSAVAGAAVS